MSLSMPQLNAAVATAAAIRRRQRLQPAGGKGDKIFPPTYPGEGRNARPVHVFERRRVEGRDVWCVLIDSVQSQANRFEEVLLSATRGRSIELPYLEVDFAPEKLEGIERVTSLDAPHRIYDAILRDSALDGTPFMESDLGVRLKKARPADAAAILEVSPTALLFGAWHSQGEGGGVGAKFARCLVSEIVGFDVPVEELVDQHTGEIRQRTAGRRTGSRIDPLGILRRVEIYKGEAGWDTAKARAGSNAKPVRPSEINHGNIAPSISPLGVTIDYAEQTSVLSLAGLRRLGFGGAEFNQAARSYLAALGLVALLELDARGYALRSRCDLVCDGLAPLELIATDGSSSKIEIDLAEAHRLFEATAEKVRAVGLKLAKNPLTLRPQPKLVEIVRKSQEHALAGEGGDDSGDE